MLAEEIFKPIVLLAVPEEALFSCFLDIGIFSLESSNEKEEMHSPVITGSEVKPHISRSS